MFSFRQEGRVNSTNLSSLGRIESLAEDWAKEVTKQSFPIQPPDLSPMANTQVVLLPTKSKSEEERERSHSPLERFASREEKGSPALVLLQNEEEASNSNQISRRAEKKTKETPSLPNKLVGSMKPRKKINNREEVSDATSACHTSRSKENHLPMGGGEPLSPFLVPRMKSTSNLQTFTLEHDEKLGERISPPALDASLAAAKRKRAGDRKEKEGRKEPQAKKSSTKKVEKMNQPDHKREKKDKKETQYETEDEEYERGAAKRRAERKQRRREKAAIVLDRSRPVSARLKSEMKKKAKADKRKKDLEDSSSDDISSVHSDSIQNQKKRKKSKGRNSRSLEESSRLAREFEPLKGRIAKGRLTVRSAAGLFSHGAASAAKTTVKLRGGKGELAFSESRFLNSFSHQPTRAGKSRFKQTLLSDDSNPEMRRKIQKRDQVKKNSRIEPDSSSEASSETSNPKIKKIRKTSPEKVHVHPRSSPQLSQPERSSSSRSINRKWKKRVEKGSVSTEVELFVNSRLRRSSTLPTFKSQEPAEDPASELTRKNTEAATLKQVPTSPSLQPPSNQPPAPMVGVGQEQQSSKASVPVGGRTEAELKLLSTYLHGNGPSQANGWRAQHTVPVQQTSPAPVPKVKIDSHPLERKASELYHQRRQEFELLEGLDGILQTDEEAFNQDRSSSPLGRLIKACDDGLLPNHLIGKASSSSKDSLLCDESLRLVDIKRDEINGDELMHMKQQLFMDQGEEQERNVDFDALPDTCKYSDSQNGIDRPMSAETMRILYFHNQKSKTLIQDPGEFQNYQNQDEEDELDLFRNDHQYPAEENDWVDGSGSGPQLQFPLSRVLAQEPRYDSNSPDPLLLQSDCGEENLGSGQYRDGSIYFEDEWDQTDEIQGMNAQDEVSSRTRNFQLGPQASDDMIISENENQHRTSSEVATRNQSHRFSTSKGLYQNQEWNPRSVPLGLERPYWNRRGGLLGEADEALSPCEGRILIDTGTERDTSHDLASLLNGSNGGQRFWKRFTC